MWEDFISWLADQTDLDPWDDPDTQPRALQWLNSVADRVRGLGKKQPPATARERLGLPQRPEDLFLRPDAAASYSITPPADQPDLPTPVLDVASSEPLSDQMRRLENLSAAEQSVEPATWADRFYGSPTVQNARTALELAIDFNPYGQGMAVAKDLGLGAVNLLQGDTGQAGAYGLATIPLLGSIRKPGGLAAADASLRPYNRAGVREQLVRSQMMNPSDPMETLIFAPPKYHTDAAFAFGGTGPEMDKLARLEANPWDNSLMDIPALMVGPTGPQRRLQLLKETGVLAGQDALAIQQAIMRELQNADAMGVPLVHLGTHEGFGQLLRGSDLDERIKALLDPNQPLFPASITMHEGRHRNIMAPFMGSPLVPIKLKAAEGTTSALLDNPLVIRQMTYGGGGFETPAQLIQAPYDLGRVREQAETMDMLLKRMTPSVADQRALDAMRTIDRPMLFQDPHLKDPDVWVDFEEPMNWGPRAVEAHRTYGWDVNDTNRLYGGFGAEPEQVEEFLDFAHRTLWDKPMNRREPLPRLFERGMLPEGGPVSTRGIGIWNTVNRGMQNTFLEELATIGSRRGWSGTTGGQW